jgi:hypothetical protein
MDWWRQLEQELARWREAGRRLQIWWRDDDAVATTAPLERLIDLTEAAAIPLALAVIPGDLHESLPPALRGRGHVTALPHGWRHENHAPPEDKKAEFGGHRPVHELLADAAMGWNRIEAAFGAAARPIFVPPWNRVDERLIELLPRAGMAGISRYGLRKAAEPAPRVVEVNCHVDPVNWRGGGGFVGLEAALRPVLAILREQRRAPPGAGEPIGLLTHHLVLDEDTWDFVAEFADLLAQSGAVHWRSVDEITRVGP